MQVLSNLPKKLPWLSISLLILALLVSACGIQPSSTSSVPTIPAASTAGSATSTSQVKNTTTTTALTTATTSSSTSSVPLTSIRMVSPLVGWATAQKTTILKTTDGGKRWINVTPHYNGTPTSVVPTFVDGLHAWVAYEGAIGQNPITILRTTNGGQSWRSATVSPTAPAGVVALQFRGSTGWLMVGIDGGPGAGHEAFGFYITTNGGQNWSALSTLYTSDQVSGISFLNTTTGFLAFGGPYSTPQLAVTHNSGRSWKNLSLPAVPGLPGAAGEYFTTPPVLFGSHGFLPVYLSAMTSSGKMVQGFVIYSTSDSGATWTAKSYKTILFLTGGPFAPSDLYIVDQTHAYVTYKSMGLALLSTNGGASWATLPGKFGNGVTSLSFTDSQNGWATGSLSGLWHTTNGGNSWQHVIYTIQ